MKTKCVCLLAVCLAWIVSTQAQESVPQLLINPDFNQPLVDNLPPGWFKAAIPTSVTGFDMGLARDAHGPYLYLKQDKIHKKVFFTSSSPIS